MRQAVWDAIGRCIASTVCSHASLRHDTQMAHRPVSNVKPQKETMQRQAREANGTKFFLSHAQLICAGAVFVVALVVYSWTLAPSVTLTDSGELIVAAYGLGVAHPPGFPLWLMLAHIASLVPAGNVAVRINFSSAVFAALACAVLTLVVAELLVTASWLATPRRSNKGSRQGSDVHISNAGALLVLAPALGAGLLMAFSRTLWAYATITEVYALNALLVLLIFFLVIRWRRRIIEARPGSTAAGATDDRWIYAAAFLFGLAMGVHHVTVALTLPAIAVVVYRTEGLKFFRSRRLLYAALISIGALIVVYSYLPWAASRSPAINWGNARSLQEIWWHVTGRQYRVFFSFSSAAIGTQFAAFWRMTLHEFGSAWLPLALLSAVAGLASAFKRDRTVFWFLLFIMFTDLAYSLSYEIAEDKDAYYLPAFIAIAIAAGLGFRWVILAASRPSPVWRSYLAAVAVIVLTSASAFAANWPLNNRRHHFIADDYVENLFSTIDRDGLLLTQDWQVASPMLYAQEVERHRTDVKVVDINLLRRSWYFDYLRHAHPGLLERSREKIDPFVEILKQWERDPAAFARSQELTQRISAAFLEMIQAIVTNEIRIAPVYMTNDLLVGDQTNSYATRWIAQKYQLVPQGLVFNLATDQSFHESADPHLRVRGLSDGTVCFAKDDVVNVKVLPAYTRMLINRGKYLALFNRHEPAILAFKEALALDPDLAEAQRGLAESTAKASKR